ncbi:putative immunity protein [Paenibacillus sp. FSL K6-1217]|uniref:putative immunity protein n=1 Tax=Paenibacillus sp. FSL K6-1217 TaxID=2921466 RepID=UPI003250E53C
MNIDDYAWNKHEQKTKKEEKEFTYSLPKIKIFDNNELRNKIEEELEKMPQKLLAQWALKVATQYLNNLDNHLINDSRINLGIETLNKRINGSIRAYDLRKVGFTVNELAKESTSDVSKYSARSFAQAIATGHMRGHAMVCSDYAIRVVNNLTNNSLDASTKERKRQLKIIDNLTKTGTS